MFSEPVTYIVPNPSDKLQGLAIYTALKKLPNMVCQKYQYIFPFWQIFISFTHHVVM